jgi:hypothetical protein
MNMKTVVKNRWVRIEIMRHNSIWQYTLKEENEKEKEKKKE